MKRIAIPFLALVVGSCTANAPESLPGHLDPHHHIRFQNGYVRVMETYLEPGQETFNHSHPIEAAVVFLTDGEFEITSDDGSVQRSTAARKTVAFGDSATVHRTRNAGETTARTVTVEVFSRPPARGEDGPDLDPGELLIDNEKVRVFRIRMAPGSATRLCGNSPSVLVTLTPGVLGPRSEGSPTTLEVGDVLWNEPGAEPVESRGSGPFEAILVLLKPRLRQS